MKALHHPRVLLAPIPLAGRAQAAIPADAATAPYTGGLPTVHTSATPTSPTRRRRHARLGPASPTTTAAAPHPDRYRAAVTFTTAITADGNQLP